MIRALVDYALNNKFVVLAIALLLLGWGAISFHNLPVEAYPDIADNYVTIITQWAGRSAEEVEQQVTIPIEIQMAGMPHMTFLRSESIFGLSFVIMIFDDTSVNDWNRQKVLERLTQVNLPNGQNLQPQIGTDWSTTGQIYWYTIRSENPRYDLMELRSLEDFVLLKQFKSVPNVVDVSDFGGTEREYQVRVDPAKLVSYGLSIGQVEQQLSNNNIGGSFVEVGMQQMNVRALGLFTNVHDIEQTVLTTKSGTPLRVKDIAEVSQGPKIRLGHMARANHMEDGHIIDESDVIQGAVYMRKGAEEESTLAAIHKKVEELNGGILPPGVTVVPMLDRSDLLHFTLNTVLHNLTEGMILVTVILFLFLLNVRSALIVALTIPFSLLFASIWLNLSGIPANLLSLGALDFGMVVDGAVVMVENIIRHLSHGGRQTQSGEPKTVAERVREACHEVQRPGFYAIAIIITAYLPIFTLQRVEGRLFRPMAWTVAFALLGAMTFFYPHCTRAGRHIFPQGSSGTAQSHHGLSNGALPPPAPLGRSPPLAGRFRGRRSSRSDGVFRLQRCDWSRVPTALG